DTALCRRQRQEVSAPRRKYYYPHEPCILRVPLRPAFGSPTCQCRLVSGQDDPSITDHIPPGGILSFIEVIAGLAIVRRWSGHAGQQFDENLLPVHHFFELSPHRAELSTLPQLYCPSSDRRALNLNYEPAVQMERIVTSYRPPQVLYEPRAFE